MSGRLEGKVAIITGAGSGIGRATALLFANEGAKLVLGDKTEAVHETARQVVSAGGLATALQIDAGVESDVANIVASAISSYGKLDVTFANAGISGGIEGIFDSTPELWSEVLRVNLIGCWLMVKHAGKAMMDAGSGGSIILTASRGAAGGTGTGRPVLGFRRGKLCQRAGDRRRRRTFQFTPSNTAGNRTDRLLKFLHRFSTSNRIPASCRRSSSALPMACTGVSTPPSRGSLSNARHKADSASIFAVSP